MYTFHSQDVLRFPWKSLFQRPVRVRFRAPQPNYAQIVLVQNPPHSHVSTSRYQQDRSFLNHAYPSSDEHQHLCVCIYIHVKQQTEKG
jgi:hypothetical protein